MAIPGTRGIYLRELVRQSRRAVRPRFQARPCGEMDDPLSMFAAEEESAAAAAEAAVKAAAEKAKQKKKLAPSAAQHWQNEVRLACARRAGILVAL